MERGAGVNLSLDQTEGAIGPAFLKVVMERFNSNASKKPQGQNQQENALHG
jgi:hypothetical protein